MIGNDRGQNRLARGLLQLVLFLFLGNLQVLLQLLLAKLVELDQTPIERFYP